MYSLEHEELSFKEQEYWDYSFQDFKWDHLANIEHIYKKTNKKVHYIGHSQGSVSMIAALSDPDREVANALKNMVDTYHLLTPVVYFVNSNIKSFLLERN